MNPVVTACHPAGAMLHLRTVLAVFLLAAGCDSPGKTAGPPPSTAAAPSPTPTPAASPEAAPPEAPTEPDLPVAGKIHYVETILGGAAPEDELPMIVAIHGLGDRPESFAHLFDAFPERARLILPRGLDPAEVGGWSWFPIRARDPDVEALSQGIAHAADELAVAIAELRESRPTRGAPIVTGFSQGGMLTFALAVRHPEVVGVAVPIGGWLPPPLWPKTKVIGEHPPIHALHGTADTAVRYGPTKEALERLHELGYETDLRTYEGVGHVLTPEIQRDAQDRLVDAVIAAGK